MPKLKPLIFATLVLSLIQALIGPRSGADAAYNDPKVKQLVAEILSDGEQDWASPFQLTATRELIKYWSRMTPSEPDFEDFDLALTELLRSSTRVQRMQSVVRPLLTRPSVPYLLLKALVAKPLDQFQPYLRPESRTDVILILLFFREPDAEVRRLILTLFSRIKSPKIQRFLLSFLEDHESQYSQRDYQTWRKLCELALEGLNHYDLLPLAPLKRLWKKSDSYSKVLVTRLLAQLSEKAHQGLRSSDLESKHQAFDQIEIIYQFQTELLGVLHRFAGRGPAYSWDLTRATEFSILALRGISSPSIQRLLWSILLSLPDSPQYTPLKTLITETSEQEDQTRMTFFRSYHDFARIAYEDFGPEGDFLFQKFSARFKLVPLLETFIESSESALREYPTEREIEAGLLAITTLGLSGQRQSLLELYLKYFVPQKVDAVQAQLEQALQLASGVCRETLKGP